MKCPHCTMENADNIQICEHCGKEIKSIVLWHSLLRGLKDVQQEFQQHVREHPTSGGYVDGVKKDETICCVYFSSEDKNRNDFLEMLVRESGWSKEKVLEFLERNDSVVFRRESKTLALELIARFEEIGIVATLGPIRSYYQKKFKLFKNGYRLTWNWPPAIFTFWWYLYSECWEKVLLGFAVQGLIGGLIGVDFTSKAITAIRLVGWSMTLVIAAYCGLFGAYDYYLKKVKGEPFWFKFPYAKYKRLFWMVFWVILIFEIISLYVFRDFLLRK